jgi:dissimilatory sulfite reductase (desulfoviridin) alpha/beta subunit
MKSDWTDQESGIALYLKKLVIPIEVAMKPYGFMARKQAHLLNLRNLRDSCTQMGKAIDGATRLRTRFRHNLIQAFVGGRGSNSLIAAFFMIDTLQGFTATQVNDIVTAAYQDNRSEKSKVFKKHAGHFIERNRRKISTVNLRRIDRQ